MVNNSPAKQAMPILLLDWVVILLCIPLGAILLVTSFDSKRWGKLVKSNNELPVLQVVRSAGITKYRPANSPTWRNVWKPSPLAPGDEVQTSSESRAALGQMDTNAQTLIELRENSRLQIGEGGSQDSSWRELLFSQADQLSWTPIVLQGSAQLTFRSPGLSIPIELPRRLKLLISWRPESFSRKSNPSIVVSAPSKPAPEVGGYVENTSQEELVLSLPEAKRTQTLPGLSKWEIRVDPLGGSTHLKILRSEFSFSKESKHNTLPETPVPLPTSPISGSKFLSISKDKEEISLRWKPIPSPYKPEVQVQKLDDAAVPIEGLPTSTGAVAYLRDGQYEWKLRVLLNGKPVTPWSSPMGFSIQENLMAAPPRVVKLSKSEKKAKRVSHLEVLPQGTAPEPDESGKHPLPEEPPQQTLREAPTERAPSVPPHPKQPTTHRQRKIASRSPSSQKDQLAVHFNHPADKQLLSRFSPIEFSWNSESNESSRDQYEFQVSRTETFDELEYEAKNSDSKVYLSLAEPGAYFWRVRKANDPASRSWSKLRTLYVR